MCAFLKRHTLSHVYGSVLGRWSLFEFKLLWVTKKCDLNNLSRLTCAACYVDETDATYMGMARELGKLRYSIWDSNVIFILSLPYYHLFSRFPRFKKHREIKVPHKKVPRNYNKNLYSRFPSAMIANTTRGLNFEKHWGDPHLKANWQLHRVEKCLGCLQQCTFIRCYHVAIVEYFSQLLVAFLFRCG